jgi:hypothetical protein
VVSSPVACELFDICPRWVNIDSHTQNIVGEIRGTPQLIWYVITVNFFLEYAKGLRIIVLSREERLQERFGAEYRQRGVGVV